MSLDLIALKNLCPENIHDEDSLSLSLDVLGHIKNQIEEIESKYSEQKSAAHKAHKAICKMESEEIKPLAEIEETVKSGVNQYFTKYAESKNAKAEALNQLGITVSEFSGATIRGGAMTVSVDQKVEYTISDIGEVLGFLLSQNDLSLVSIDVNGLIEKYGTKINGLAQSKKIKTTFRRKK